MSWSIAWIGASFYFIWLDNHLEKASEPQFAGELYAIHGGGFYRAQKYRLAPEKLPSTLHWFKWEAYWTGSPASRFSCSCITQRRRVPDRRRSDAAFTRRRHRHWAHKPRGRARGVRRPLPLAAEK